MSATAEPRSADTIEIEVHYFGERNGTPNNFELPALILRAPLAGKAPGAVEALFRANGWGGTWHYTVFDFHHYHPNAHEVLGVTRGSATLILGGPDRLTARIEAGDVLILPAGTGHCRQSASADFAVCGAYPPGQEDYETVRIDAPCEDASLRIARVPLPASDPVYGADGPILTAWASGGNAHIR